MVTMKYTNPNDQWTHQDDDEREAEGCLRVCGYVIIASLVIVLMALLTSCKHTEYVTVPEYHTDTLILTKVQRDSIHVHDSKFVEVKGDTVLIERWHTKFVEKLLHDTLYQSKTDTVAVAYPVEKQVEKQLSWWQLTQMYAGDVLLILIAGGAVYGVIRIKRLFS